MDRGRFDSWRDVAAPIANFTMQAASLTTPPASAERLANGYESRVSLKRGAFRAITVIDADRMIREEKHPACIGRRAIAPRCMRHHRQATLDVQGGSMSADTNMAFVRRYYAECANNSDPGKQHALSVADEILSANFAMSYNSQPDAEAMRGLDRHKEFLVGHAHTFRDEHWTIEAIVADERIVACQWRVQATHTDTGNRIDIRGADFFTVAHGQLAELRRFLDVRTLTEQMQPAPPQPEGSA
jgi:ketosteroid isomerase-like protein